MAKFMLILRDSGDFDPGIGAEEIQKIIARYQKWRAGLEAKGKVADGQKLSDGEGRIVRRDGRSLAVSDGPFAESKEVVGGYFTLLAADYDEAVELSKDCPHLDFGSIEIRKIDELGSGD
ncbi:MAG TPA: YciI family protein [Thermoanaerobaculia bacterium]|nr:YciI family protein [Thermoanaerobaculia bacterium]